MATQPHILAVIRIADNFDLHLVPSHIGLHYPAMRHPPLRFLFRVPARIPISRLL